MITPLVVTVDNCEGTSELIKHQDKHDIPTLFINDQLIHSAVGKANALNNYFKSIFTEGNLLIIPTMDSLTDVPSMPNITVSQSGMHRLLATLNEHKASGPHRISPYILKHCADEITPTLYAIFNQSLSTSLLPNDWLKANM